VYNSTGNNVGFVVRPFAFQLGERPEARAAMERGAYSVSENSNADTTMFPDVTIPAYLSALTSNAGAAMTHSHGSTQGQIIEVYPWTSAGETKRDEQLVYYSVFLSLASVVAAANEDGVGYGIAVRYSGLTASRVVFGYGIFHNQSCDGYSFPYFSSIAFLCGPQGVCDGPNSVENVRAFWENLEGKYELYYRPTLPAMGWAPQLTKKGGYDDVVLFPKVKGFSHHSGTRVPSGGIDVWMQTDCKMNTGTIPASMIVRGDGDITIQNASYGGVNDIRARIVPTPGVVSGEGHFVVSGAWAAYNSGLVTLEGMQDQLFRFIVGDGPAAEISGFHVEDGFATFDVASESQTAYYEIEEAAEAEGPWRVIGTPEPAYAGTHSVEIEAANGSLLRLVEVERETSVNKPGRRIVHKYAHVGSRATVLPRVEPSMEEKLAAIEERKRTQFAKLSQLPVSALSLAGERMVIWTPGSAVAYVNTYLAEPCRWIGMTVSVTSVDGFAALGNDSLFALALKASIADSAAAGADYVWLVGDDGDPLHAQAWPDSAWEAVRQQQLSSGYDPTGRVADVEIPAFVVRHPEPRAVGFTFHAPYGKSDLPYANVDNDSLGIRDVYLARLPFSDYSRVVNYGYKFMEELSGDNGIGGALLLDHDLDHDDAGDGALADSLVTLMALTIPAAYSVDILRMSDHLSDDINVVVADQINQLRPNYLGGFSPLSHELFIFNMIDKTVTPPWSMSLLNHKVSLCDFSSCGGAGFWRNGNPTDGPGLPTEWLGAWEVGAVNIKGYGDGSWQHVIAGEAQYFLQEIAADPNQAACAASTKASNRLRQDYSEKVEYLDVDATKFFLGNPVTAIVMPGIATAIQERPIAKQLALQQNYPNPFNPATRIPYTLTKAGLVKISIFNLQGQTVRRLVDEVKPVGPYLAEWDGRNDVGDRVASGVYFYRLSTDRKHLTKKMTLLK
jgi:hypothetical protein